MNDPPTVLHGPRLRAEKFPRTSIPSHKHTHLVLSGVDLCNLNSEGECVVNACAFPSLGAVDLSYLLGVGRSDAAVRCKGVGRVPDALAFGRLQGWGGV